MSLVAPDVFGYSVFQMLFELGDSVLSRLLILCCKSLIRFKIVKHDYYLWHVLSCLLLGQWSKSVCQCKRLESLEDQVGRRSLNSQWEWDHNWDDNGPNALLCYVNRLVTHFSQELPPKNVIFHVWIVESSRVTKFEVHLRLLVLFNLHIHSDWLSRLLRQELISIFTRELVPYFIEQSRLSVSYVADNEDIFGYVKLYLLKLDIVT